MESEVIKAGYGRNLRLPWELVKKTFTKLKIQWFGQIKMIICSF